MLLIAVCLFQLTACSDIQNTTLTAPSGVTVKVFASFDKEDVVIEPISTSVEGDITTYLFDLEPGLYHFTSSGEGFFSLRKNFSISDKPKLIDANPGTKTGLGYENKGTASAYTDECSETAISTKELQKKYKKALATPSFTANKTGETYATQEELEAYLNEIDDDNDNLYSFVIGQTVNGKDIPFIVMTTTDITGLSLEDAAAAVRANEKPTVYLHALIHGNEPSSGDGALAAISELDGKYGKKMLPSVNVIVVPRVNGDGIEAWTRGTSQVNDLNRDNLHVKSPEIKATHYVYNLFMPEIVVDMHEYGVTRNFRAYEGYIDDAGITVSGNQNNTPELNKLMLDMMRGAEAYAAEEGLRLWEYTQGGYSDQSPLHASHYYALRGSVNFLVETPSAGCEKKSTYARRVFTQFIVAKYMIDYAAANADQLRSIVANDRATVAADGEIYTTNNPIVLKHGQNEEGYSYLRSQFDYVTGEKIKDTTFTLKYYEVPLITRPRPTAYLIPKDVENIDRILEIATYNGIAFYEVDNTKAFDLRKYKGDGKEAELLQEKTYVFANGAYVFQMNQSSGIVLGMLMEPDMRMTDRNPISLHQAELLEIDDIYRCEKDLNEGNLVSTPVESLPKLKYTLVK